MVIAGIIVLVVFVAIVGGVVFMVMKTMNQTDPRNAGTATYESKVNKSDTGQKQYEAEKMLHAQTAQEFLPFNTIENGVIDLGQHKYRAIIDVSSINYGLRTGTEKEAIELSFQRFLNSLAFPITMFIQTKTIDDTKLLKDMENELIEITDKFPLLTDYANNYFYEISRLGERIGNNKQKKKYIIVPFDDALLLKNLEEKDMKSYAMKELATRTHSIIDGLTGVGLKATRLDSLELCELIYSVTHKENYNDFESVFNGEYTDLIVTNDEIISRNLKPEEVLDWILYEAEIRIQNEINADNNVMTELIGELEQMRRSYGNTDTFPKLDKSYEGSKIELASFNDLLKGNSPVREGNNAKSKLEQSVINIKKEEKESPLEDVVFKEKEYMTKVNISKPAVHSDVDDIL